tara:strand:+ start:4180 stop:4419 length:240 start_codon:yes stop_codon:yes gene_type:complete
LLFTTENPSLNFISFHHKHPVPRSDDVVGLGGPVFRGQGNVLDEMIAGIIEKESGGKINHRLPDFAFAPGRLDDHRQDE